MKVIVDKKDQRVLGAAVLGIRGDEIIHEFIDLMYAGTPYTVVRDSVPIHPTVSELIPTMLKQLDQ
jgi:pyruvate/2-oxoglutarate dehydrogenase complex dihydrolipoamide dehydrogenase (E3) component